ncbi:MAG: thermonuclease family protein [Oligosphaeraceae bacterium]
MRRGWLLLLCALLGGGFLPSLPARENNVPDWKQLRPEERNIQAVVIRVADGDTIDVRDRQGTVTRIRFYGVDAPESSQEFGGDARRYVSKSLIKREVRVEGRNRDQYGRLVGRVFLDGRDFCLEMIRHGMAWCYAQYCDDPAYMAAQEEARKAGRGLWAAERRGEPPMAPWEFRRAHPRREKKTAQEERRQEAPPGEKKEEPKKAGKPKEEGRGRKTKNPGKSKGRLEPAEPSRKKVEVRGVPSPP